MVFKLLGYDDGNISKVTLSNGTHILGRGSLLNVHDKRISRKHGRLEVTDDALIVTALHQNPCFYKKRGTMESQLIKQDCSVTLNSGDKLGLLPDSTWFDVLHCEPVENDDANGEKCKENNVTDADNGEETDTEGEPTLSVENIQVPENEQNMRSESNPNIHDAVTQLPFEFLEKQNARDNDLEKELDGENVSTSTHCSSSPTDLNMEETNRDEGEPVTTVDRRDDISEDSVPISGENKTSPQKRSHDTEEECVVKKIKVETEDESDVKMDPNVDKINQAGSSNTNDNGDNKSPPPAPLRERCMYGVNCYRRNPAHLAQYSHPRDADWGAGPRAPCPHGAACAKRDARHWRDHDHPPGKDQPPPPPPPPGCKKKRDRGDSPVQNLIVTGKRARRSVSRACWSDSDGSESDPFKTDDESDEWQPSSEYTENAD